MKNVRIFLFAVILIAIASAVAFGNAESIFPPLTPVATPQPAYEPEVLIAPSYGAMANTAPDSVAENTQGGTIVTYGSVTADDFNRFGSYLGEKNFSVIDQEEKDGQLAYVISDGSVEFVLIYDPSGCALHLIYPQGMKYEECFFPGYTPLEYGSEVYIPNLGKFTFIDFELNKEDYLAGMAENYYGSWFYYDENGTFIGDKKTAAKKVYSFLGFEFYNTTAKDLAFYEGKNEILTATLYYVHDEYGTFSYEQFTQGCYSSKPDLFMNGYSLNYDGTYYMSYPAKSLTSSYKYVFFDLPEGIRKGSEGTLFVTIDFITGEKYVMPLHVNGEDVFE